MIESEQVEMFADFFNANFKTNSVTSNWSSTELDVSTAECFLLDEFFVFDQLMNLKTATGVGPDGIHPLVLKNCSSILYLPLAYIFNESLETGNFQDVWKRYSVKPIFKKGSRANGKNHRSIAKLQTIAKFFEHCVNVNFMRIVRPFISPNQHGFMKRRSTSTNLMDFIHYSINGLKACNRVDVLYLDFSKAFDRVNYSILLGKLLSFEISKNIIKWIGSYLSNRRQYVKLGAAESADFIVNSGVPQGSHIGPTLFLLFKNDLPPVATDDVFLSMFTDDIRVAKKIAHPNDISGSQSTIDCIHHWCNLNDLHLNLDKCSILMLYRGRSPPNAAFITVITSSLPQTNNGILVF